MKYSEEWQQTQNKEKFVELLLKKFPLITKKTATRRYYDVRHTPLSTLEPTYYESDLKDEKPVGIIKMMMIKDMNKYKIKITVLMLKQHGFTKPEIQWLKRNKHIVLEE